MEHSIFKNQYIFIIIYLGIGMEDEKVGAVQNQVGELNC